jgi:translation initiation factor 2B subunit (eIF-2B alpha/beta/delta family)
VLSRRDKQSRAVIEAAINQIASDNTSGAAEILRRAGAVFTLLNARSSAQGADNSELAQQAVIQTCIALAVAQPHMSPLLRLASAALSAARIATGARESLKSAEDAALDFAENAQRAARDAAMHAATLIRNDATVLTHSRSSTVLAAFLEAKRRGRDFSVVATESRPMLEGRVLAEAIASQDIRVTLIADAAASLAMEQVDLVMVGADQITPVNLVNKIGTRMIALAARERDLPLYALCDTSKFIREDYFGRGIRDLGGANELWPEAPRGVAVGNRCFEPTPLACFTGIITEDGALSIKEVARRAEKAAIDKALVNAFGVLCGGIK